MANDLSSALQELLIDILQPLDEAARDPAALVDWLAAIGYTDAISGHPTLLQIAQHGQALIGTLAAFDAQTLQTTTGLISLLATAREAAAIMQELRTFAADPARSQFAETLAEELMSFLLASYLRRKHPTAFRIAALLTLIDARETATIEPPIIDSDTTLRYARVLDHFRFETLAGLVHQPGATLKGIYMPNDLAQGADAWLAAQRLFPSLSFLADALGLSWHTAYRSNAPLTAPTDSDPDQPIHDSEASTDPENPATPDAPDEAPPDEPLPALPPVPDAYYAANDPTLQLDIIGDAASSGLALAILAASQKHPGGIAGFVLELVGDLNRTATNGQSKLTFSASGALPALALGPQGFVRVPADNPLANGTAKLLIERIPDAGASGAAFLFGSPQGTRLEIGTVKLTGDLSFDQQQWSASFDLAASSGALVLAASDGDSFLSSVLPANGMRAEFDMGLGWSNTGGMTLHGSAGLDVTLPINRSIGGVRLSSIYLKLQVQDASLLAEVAASMSVALGPVQATIDQIGLGVALRTAEHGGNLGILDFDFSFKPPNGLGLAIDAQAILGGGYLNFDLSKQEYSGVLELQIAERIAVKGIGVLTTRLPAGASGYSLVVIIFAEGFAPIQLGLGFTLTGIGGLLAINRTFDEAVLRAGIKNHTLDSILFPRDPIRNAPQIISNLNKAFPPAKGHHLFGPMVQIAWGTPPLITADLALVLEFGARLRLLILAQVVAVLPSRDNDLLHLQMDAVGVIDFDQGTAALDATLHDSRLLKFVLTGDMAMRLQWAGSRNFALAVGGLHPAFNPPPNFPKLDRIAINLAAGDNPRIRCEAYFALTANTQQFGARAELYAAAAGFSIHGEIGFDVLLQIDPFAFVADFHAQLQLKHGSTSLFKVKVEGELAGPRPLHIKAKATFEILWWDVSIKIDKTLVAGERPPQLAPVDVLPQLKAALSDPANWLGRLPDGQRPIVTLRAIPARPHEVLLHPLGSLTVKQGVVPLDLDISRFGQATPAGAHRFTISSVSLGEASQTVQPVKDFFAPAQFFELSDGDKLSRPSFEPMTAGVSFGSNEFVFTDVSDDWLEVEAIAFDTIIVDKQANISRPSGSKELYQISAEQLGQQARFGAAAASELRRTGSARYRTITGKYRVAKEGWSIVASADLAVHLVPGSVAGAPVSYSEAVQALRKLEQDDPAIGGLKILRLSEIAG